MNTAEAIRRVNVAMDALTNAHEPLTRAMDSSGPDIAAEIEEIHRDVAGLTKRLSAIPRKLEAAGGR
jgi:hypothetical protein